MRVPANIKVQDQRCCIGAKEVDPEYRPGFIDRLVKSVSESASQEERNSGEKKGKILALRGIIPERKRKEKTNPHCPQRAGAPPKVSPAYP